MDYVQATKDCKKAIASIVANETLAEYHAGMLYGVKLARLSGDCHKPEDLEEAAEDAATSLLFLPDHLRPGNAAAFKRGVWEGYLARRGGWLCYHIESCPHPAVVIDEAK